ncbi:uncharacterized protein KY384_002625 [Bacidia gigantensis]|uniref:uncharacterized protein n=1 Tax=Bacidia gigantensis TaxID=2732470 RepID=UPI001D04D874|nr:uncharacterized protein KY384_002625 [Bacidia gigantensis]KAG8532747.1 hypothetical protein KY384_002625 [Bacidia gigantensis]
MSSAYDRESQNNSRLDELSSKVSALRGVTINIYDNARSQDVIDSSSEVFSSMSGSIKGSAQRLGRMAQSGNKVAIFKLAGIIVAVVVVLWWILHLAFGSRAS